MALVVREVVMPAVGDIPVVVGAMVKVSDDDCCWLG